MSDDREDEIASEDDVRQEHEITPEQIADAKRLLARANPAGPARFKAVVSLKTAGDRVLFSSVSKNRTKRWIEDRCPRGSHIFLLNPNGEMFSYEHERLTGGPRGEELDPWQPFNRDDYQAPDLTPVSAHDPWADAWEGAN